MLYPIDAATFKTALLEMKMVTHKVPNMYERLFRQLCLFFIPFILAPEEKAKILLSGLAVIAAAFALIRASIAQIVQANYFFGFLLQTAGACIVVCFL